MSLGTLAIVLRDLDRNDESLERANEAASLYYKLTRAGLTAFTPDFARSLNVLSGSLSTLGKREQAIKTSEEALRTLAPFFLLKPVEFEELMGNIATTYCKTCQAGQREYDLKLLEPIVKLLETIGPGRWKWP